MSTRVGAFALAPAAAAAVLALAGCGGDGNDESSGEATTTGTGAAGKTIEGYVGPGFDIKVEEADNLTPGTYTLKVEDKSSSHNFHLTGPGVDVKTDVGFEGEQTFTIELQAGQYHFQCDPHSSSMNGDFTVS
jgi:plastocyanin